MSQLYFLIDEMEVLASSVYDATPAAVGGAFSSLGAVAEIFRHLDGYLAGLIVVAPYIGGSADTRATGLAEAHAEVIVGVLKKADDAQYSEYIKRKLVEWYDLAPKSDRHAPRQEERGDEVHEDGEEGGRGMRVHSARYLIWSNTPGCQDR